MHRAAAHRQPAVRVCLLVLIGVLMASVSPVPSRGAAALVGGEVQGGLVHPWDIGFLPSGEMVVTERAGRVRVFASGAAGAPLLRTVNVPVRAEGEAGLMGLAVDHAFAENGRIYLCASRSVGDAWLTEVLAYEVGTDGGWTSDGVVLSDIIAGTTHNGCALEMGPDGKLWVTTGDASAAALAQEPTSLNGKVLRVNADGTIPADNPVLPGTTAPTAVYTLGHRNPQGLAFRPGSGDAYAIEHGPTLDDEANLLVPGANHGWPCVTGPDTPYPAGGCAGPTDFADPVWSSGTPTIATAGATFLAGAAWDGLDGQLVVATLKQQDLRTYSVAGDGTLLLTGVHLDGTFGRLRTPVLGPDGRLYVTTSNGTADRVIAVELSAAQSPTPTPDTVAHVLVPQADAYVDSDAPGAAYGTASRLKVKGTAPSRQMVTYLRFDLSGIGYASSIRLRLYATDGSTDAGAVSTAPTGWDEGTLSWSTRPSGSSSTLAPLGSVPGGWVEIDLTGKVTPGGVIGLAVGSGSTDTATFHSREAIFSPELVVVEGGASTVTPTPTPSVPATATPTATPSTSTPVTLAPIRDSYVDSRSPTSNFGGATRLKVSGASRQFASYLVFDVRGVGTAASAVLRLYATDASPSAGSVSPTTADWTESGVTWGTRPTASGPAVADVGAATKGAWVEVDVTPAVRAGGIVAVVVAGTGTDAAAFHSREASKPPQLVVTPSTVATATPTATAPATPTPTATATPLATETPTPTPAASGSAEPSPNAAIPGYGAGTVGGAGGRVIKVTSLADSGPGSLREALSAAGPRIVEFDVAGLIDLDSPIVIHEPYLTVDGSMAPGAVVVRGGQIQVQASHVILRHLRLRPGDDVVSPADEDALTIRGTQVEVHHVVVDNMTLVWGPDIGGLAILGNVHDITVMDSILGEGLYRSRHPLSQKQTKGHSHAVNITQLKASLTPPQRITLVGNLLTTSNERMPQLQGAGCVDIVNNVIYNWGILAAEGNPRSVNVVNNVFRAGPELGTDAIWSFSPSDVAPSPYPASVHLDGNRADGFSPTSVGAAAIFSSGPTCPLSVTPHDPGALLSQVAASAGALLPVRDAVDQRIVADVLNRTGQFMNGVDGIAPTPTWD